MSPRRSSKKLVFNFKCCNNIKFQDWQILKGIPNFKKSKRGKKYLREWPFIDPAGLKDQETFLRLISIVSLCCCHGNVLWFWGSCAFVRISSGLSRQTSQRWDPIHHESITPKEHRFQICLIKLIEQFIRIWFCYCLCFTEALLWQMNSRKKKHF